MAEMAFDSSADLDEALIPMPGAESARDLRNFAGAGVTHVRRARRGRCLSPASPAAADPRRSASSGSATSATPMRGVATVTIDRPEVLNALDFQTLRELARAFEQASWDDRWRSWS